jgi:hypothetical protein
MNSGSYLMAKVFQPLSWSQRAQNNASSMPWRLAVALAKGSKLLITIFPVMSGVFQLLNDGQPSNGKGQNPFRNHLENHEEEDHLIVQYTREDCTFLNLLILPETCKRSSSRLASSIVIP